MAGFDNRSGDRRPGRRRIVVADGLSVGEAARCRGHGFRRCKDDVDGGRIPGLAPHPSHNSPRSIDRFDRGNHRDVSPRRPEPANDAALRNFSGNWIDCFTLVRRAYHRLVRVAVSLSRMYGSRLQILLTIVAGLFLLGTVSIFAVFALAPGTAVVYRPVLLTTFVVTLFVSLVCVAWLMRGLLKPYSQLIGEAQRAPVAHSGKRQNEAAFVLETFQTVIAQLQEQQKELQRLSEQASQRADSAEAFSDRIVASMPTGLLAFDANGHATVSNGPARDLFHHSRIAPGQHFKTVFADFPALAEMVDACLSSGRLYRREEIETTNGAETVKRLGATVAPIDPASETGSRGALCLITDITEVTRLREQVALKKNLESLGEMSAGLAHEFKNAMAALHGYAQFLQSVDADEQGKAAADALLQEVRNLSEMTTAFLNFARPQPLQLEEVSLNELIAECARELRPLFESRRVELVIASALGRSPTVSEPPAVAGGPPESRGSSPAVREGVIEG